MKIFNELFELRDTNLKLKAILGGKIVLNFWLLVECHIPRQFS